MGAYKLYWVGQCKIKPGKSTEAQKWWEEKGKPNILSKPWTKSVKIYAVQFGLGGEYIIEIWSELESYASFDEMDKFWEENSEEAKQFDEVLEEANEYFEWGHSRLMGDWPESNF